MREESTTRNNPLPSALPTFARAPRGRRALGAIDGAIVRIALLDVIGRDCREPRAVAKRDT